MDDEMEVLLNECEASWPTTKELAFVINDPLEKLMEKAKKIFKGRHWDNLDALAVRIADKIPGGVTESNFDVAEPIAGAARKYFSNVEKLRNGLNRPFLDAKKAVDQAAKATVDRAEPTLKPIIDAVKKIQDRKKREEEAKAEAERKRIEDERLAAEKAHRDKLEAEQAAERKRMADEREQLAAERKRMADEKAAADAKAKAVNDELAALKRQMKEDEEKRKDAESEKAKLDVVIEPGIKTPPSFYGPQGRPAKLVPMDSHGYPVPPRKSAAEVEAEGKECAEEHAQMRQDVQSKSPTKLTDAELNSLMFDAENSAELSKAGVETSASSDQQKVREFGIAVSGMLTTLKRPLLVKQAARQAVELAVFDMVESCKRLQEWSGT